MEPNLGVGKLNPLVLTITLLGRRMDDPLLGVRDVGNRRHVGSTDGLGGIDSGQKATA